MIGRLRNRWVRIGLRVLATLVIVTVLFVVVGWGDVWAALVSASWPWLVAMYAVALGKQVIDAFQLRYLLAQVGSPVPLRRVFLASQLASFYSIVLPGDVAASTAKWADLSIATGRRSLVLTAMVYNRLMMLSVPVLVGTIALIVDDPFDEAWVVALAAVILAGIVFALLLLYHPRLGSWSERLLRALASKLPKRVGDKIGYVITSLAAIRALPLRDHLRVLGFVTAGVGMGVVRIWFGMLALDLGVSPLAVLWIMAFNLIGRLLPITIASLGIRESLLIVALTPLGVARERSVALGLLGFSTILMLALIGAAYQISLVLGRRSAASADG